jgi:geranylgeranyl diphosphate synthase type I
VAAYSAFGVALGEAFQLRDDILGAFGDPDVTGKSNLDDFREGKPTVLVAQAMRHADPAQRRVLERTLGDPALDGDGAARVRDVLLETGAVAAVEKMIDERCDRARRALKDSVIAEPARTALECLITTAVHRTS